jgi:hypothetical protein
MGNMHQMIESWFDRHFGNYTPGTEIYAALQAAKRDLHATFGTVSPSSPPAPISAPTPEQE